MSRIGKQPIPVPGTVQIDVGPRRRVQVSGPKGKLEIVLRPEVDLEVAEGAATITLNGSGQPRQARAYHGMTRALVANMVGGVTEGYRKDLEIIGVGWNASAQPRKVVLNIGFCHPVDVALPEGVEAETPNPTTIIITGIDKQAVGQVAAQIRKVRPPEPYKGKGIRYKDEFVRRKAGKSFGS